MSDTSSIQKVDPEDVAEYVGNFTISQYIFFLDEYLIEHDEDDDIEYSVSNIYTDIVTRSK